MDPLASLAPTSPPAPRTGADALMLFGGVLLPLIAIAFELQTRLSRNVFFDPVPDFFHALLILTVPLACGALLVAQRCAFVLPRAWLLLTSFATRIAGFYTLLYLPLTPIAPFAMVWFGLGFVILAPMISLINLLLGRKRQGRLAQQHGLPSLRSVWVGVVLAAAALMAAGLPPAATRLAMRISGADNPTTSLAAIGFLRVAGDQDLLLRLCYPQSGMSTGLSGLLLDSHSTVSTEQARAIYFRVTGTPFNSLPQPVQHAISDWRNAIDSNVGGDTVAGRANGVSLYSSRMDGSIDANAAVSYLEWTMVFKNSAPLNQEARAEVALPPGAVVSRLTLWIDGEEREAAFGGRGQVRQAYQNVVRRNRDPVLITTAGKDRVLVQLFPILPNGEMKIRIGITAPLALPHLAQAQLALPYFSERNFEFGANFRHAIVIESLAKLLPVAGLTLAPNGRAGFALSGLVAEPAEGQAATLISAARTAELAPSWTRDMHDQQGRVIVQTVRLAGVTPPRRIALVVDGSLSMRAARTDLIKALAAVPAGVELALVLAGDTAPTLLTMDPKDGAALRQALANFDFEGGRDNTEALLLAWDWAAQQPASAVVWLHGPQPLEHPLLDTLVQRYERQAQLVTLHDMPLAKGSDQLAWRLDSLAALTKVARAGTVQQDLTRLFASWTPGTMLPVVARQRQERADLSHLPVASSTSSHLARLWAAGEVARLLGQDDAGQRKQALDLALRYQLVTPVSGAVVLETAAQYQQAGLEPVPPGSVPTIPEPETWLMMIVALALLAWRYRARKPAGAA